MGGITVLTKDLKSHTWHVILRSLALAASSFAAVPVCAEDLDQEPAIAWTADDSRLQWGPCPAFLPEWCGIAVLHGDRSKANADVFFKVPANSKLPLHWHTSAERMVLIAGELHVTYEGQGSTILRPGAYAYGPAKRSHDGFCASADPCVLFIAFESPVDAVPIHGKQE
jgi:uncharacterized RmlC-like cupin family protein